jgi:glycosyltransferase involved in cell wall biosynthesis
VDEVFYAPEAAPADGYVLSVGKDFSRDFATLVAACEGLACRLVLKTSLRVDVPESMRERVRFVREDISGRDLRALYAGAAIVVVPLIPTDNPGGISTVLEGMSMAKPMIVSDTGTMVSVVTDGVDGLIVPPKDVAALQAALLRVLADPGLGNRLGQAARRTIIARYGMDARHGQLAKLLREISGAPPWQGES